MSQNITQYPYLQQCITEAQQISGHLKTAF